MQQKKKLMFKNYKVYSEKDRQERMEEKDRQER